MKAFTSQTPYLIRMFHAWSMTNDLSPHIRIDATHPDLLVPIAAEKDGVMVLNISPSAVQFLEMTDDSIRFTTRFSGISTHVVIPIDSILAIFDITSSNGIDFQRTAMSGWKDNDSVVPKTPTPPIKPKLRIV